MVIKYMDENLLRRYGIDRRENLIERIVQDKLFSKTIIFCFANNKKPIHLSDIITSLNLKIGKARNIVYEMVSFGLLERINVSGNFIYYKVNNSIKKYFKLACASIDGDKEKIKEAIEEIKNPSERKEGE